MKQLLITFLIYIAFWSCDKQIAPKQIDQEFLLKYEYSNYAWGHQHRGWLLDSAGNIFQFAQPVHWRDVDANFEIEQDSLKDNANQGILARLKVSKIDILNITAYAKDALKNDLSEPVNRSADMGSSTISVYLYDSITKRYTEQLIYQWGDWERKRENGASQQLIEFVNRINGQIE